MASEKVMSIATVVIVILAAVGGCILMKDMAKDNITGVYHPYGGSEGRLTDDGVIFYGVESYKEDFVIEYFDGNLFKGTWGEDPIMGSYEDGYARICSFFGWEEGDFIEIGNAYFENGVMFYSSICTNEDDSMTVADMLIFAKDGAKVDFATPEPMFEPGTVLESYMGFRSVDGQCTTVEGMDISLSVMDYHGGIYLLELSRTVLGMTFSDRVLAVHSGLDSLEAGFTEQGIIDIFTDGIHAVVNLNYVVDGHDVASSYYLSASEPLDPKDASDLSGLVFTGTEYIMESNVQTIEKGSTLSFGEAHGNIIDVVCTSDGNTYMKTAHATYEPIHGGYYINFCSDYTVGGVSYYRFIDGYVDAEKKTFTSLSCGFIEQGMKLIVSKKELTVSDRDGGIIGCYTLSEGIRLCGTELTDIPADSYNRYFTIISIDRNIVFGTFHGEQFVGALTGSKLTFSLVNPGLHMKNGYFSMEFSGNGAVKRNIGITDSDESFVSVSSYRMAGTDSAPEIPVCKTLFDAGDSFQSFQTLCRIGTEDVVSKEDTASLRCLYSGNGLYCFAADYNGTSVILNGYSIEDCIIRLAGDMNGRLITMNINKHETGLVCLDREYITDGRNAVVVYRMSSDGEPRDLVEIPQMDGRMYSGKSYVGILENGKVKVIERTYSTLFSNQTGSIVSSTNEDSETVHVLGVTANEGMLNYFSTFDVDGRSFSFEVYCDLINGGKDIVIYAINYGPIDDKCAYIVTVQETE